MNIKISTLRIVLTFVLFVVRPAPNAFAVSPAPDGCYPNFTVAEGCDALNFLTTGAGNTGVGWRSLFLDSSGSFNTGVGGGALSLNNGDSNTAVGAAALLLNTGGIENVAVGTDALVFNDSGSDNSALGAFALLNNTADGNTAIGAFALQANTTGGTLGTTIGFPVGPNTAVGSHALESNTISSGNTAVGYEALRSTVAGFTGGDLGVSTAVGFQALANVNGPASAANDAYGYQALFDLTDGNNNVAIGTRAGLGLTSGAGNVYIGTNSGAGASSELNHTYIKNINTTSVSGGNTDTVTVDLSTGLLGHLTSSRRHKEDIKPMDTASLTLYRLKPVTYRYKKEIDKTQALDYGLVAEDVAGIDPNLTVCNKDGQIESVRYTAINAMLLNEFLKEHRKVQELEATVAKQRKDFEAAMAKLEKNIATRLQKQAAEIEEVHTQIEMKRSAPKLAAKNR